MFLSLPFLDEQVAWILVGQQASNVGTILRVNKHSTSACLRLKHARRCFSSMMPSTATIMTHTLTHTHTYIHTRARAAPSCFALESNCSQPPSYRLLPSLPPQRSGCSGSRVELLPVDTCPRCSHRRSSQQLRYGAAASPCPPSNSTRPQQLLSCSVCSSHNPCESSG